MGVDERAEGRKETLKKVQMFSVCRGKHAGSKRSMKRRTGKAAPAVGRGSVHT